MSRVFDTNIMIYHLNGKLDEAAERMLEQALQENARISVITRIEVLGWPGQSEEAFQRAKNLLDQFNEQPLTDDIAGRCITLRRQRRLKVPDAIIAATALHLNLPLVTRNTDDFKGIEGLGLINPFAPQVTPASGDKTS
jgi:predicted nucleic acid-binding protein